MKTPLRVLLLMNDLEDVKEIINELRNAEYDPDWNHVTTKKDFQNKLTENYDLVFSDYRLPRYDALRALTLLQNSSLDIPFIVLSSDLDNDMVKECLDQGVDACIQSDQLIYLNQAISNAFERKRLREEKNIIEEALQEKYHNLENNTSDGIVSLDRRGNILEINDKAAEVAGVPAAELLGKNIAQLSSLIKFDTQTVISAFNNALKGKWDPSREWTITNHSNQQRVLQARFSLIKDAEQISKASVIIDDITERKFTENALRNRLVLEKLISTISNCFVNVTSVEINARIDQALEAIGLFTRVDHCYLCQFSDDGSKINNTHEWYEAKDGSKSHGLLEISRETYPWLMEKLTSNEVIQIPTLKTIPLEAKAERNFMRKQGVKSSLIFPLVFGQELIGYLGIDSIRKEINWVEDDINLLKITGEIIITTLARTRMEDAIKQSERDYRGLFENAHDAIVIFSPENEVVLEVNQRACDIYGFTRDEFIGMSLEKISKDVAHGKTEITKTIKTGHYYNFESIQYRKDKTEMFLEINASIVDYKGQKAILSINRDVTERKATEEALRKSEERYRNLFNGVPIGLYRTTPNGKVVDANQALAEILGYPNRDAYLLSEPFATYVDKKDRERWKREVEKKGILHNYISQHKRIDGKAIWVEESAKVVYDNEGNISHYEGSFIDITDRINAEKSLRESEERYRAVVQDQTEMITRCLPDGTITFANNAYARYFRKKPEDLIGANINSLIRKESLETMHETFSQLNPKKPVISNIQQTVNPEGQTRWHLWTNRLISDDQGNPCEYQSVGSDITELKQIEDALRESESRYRTVSELTSDYAYSMVVNSNDDYTYEWVTEAFERITGYSASEINHLGPLSIFHPDDQPKVKEILKRILAGESLESEFRIITKDEKVHWLHSHNHPVQVDSTGEITRIIGASTDITEQKQRDQELEAIVSVSQALRSATSRVEMLPIILDQSHDLLSTEGSALIIHDPTSGENVIELGRGAWKDFTDARLAPGEGITAQVITSGEPYYNNNISTNPDPRLFHLDLINEAMAAACVPLIAQEETIGTLWIGKKEPIREDDMRHLSVISNIAANAIHRTTLNENNIRALQESIAVTRIGQTLNETLDLDEIFHLITESTLEIIPNVHRAIIHIFDEKNDRLHSVAVSDRDSSKPFINFPKMKVTFSGEFNFSELDETVPQTSQMVKGKGLAGYVIETGEMINIGNVHDDPRFLPSESTSNIHSMLIAPVLSGDRRLGTISVLSDVTNTFTQVDERLLKQLGIQATTAIENARQYESERVQREVAEAHTEVIAAINRTLELDEVLDQILGQTIRVFECSAVNIMLIDDDMAQIVRFFSNDEVTQGIDQNYLLSTLPLSMPTLQYMYTDTKPILVADTEKYSEWNKGVGYDWVHSYIGAPLQIGDNVIGFLNADSKQVNFFNEDDSLRLQAFADDAAIAIHNAGLYKDLEYALKQEKATRVQLLQADKLTGMGRMVASVAHELNNPLQTIKNCLFLIEPDLKAKEDNELISMALSEVERLSNIVARLREVYRPRNQDMLQNISIPSLLADVQMLLETHLRRQKVKWEQSSSDDSFIISGIEDQLKQVFLNLSLNAIEAMQPEGGTLAVEIICSTNHEEVGILFKDTGPGISPEYIQYVFDPFFTTKETGMGLGLSICYDITQNHNGKITVESNYGEGATFTVWLPLISQEG